MTGVRVPGRILEDSGFLYLALLLSWLRGMFSLTREPKRRAFKPTTAGPFLCPLSFVTTNCALQFSSRGIRPGLTTVLARNLDKNTVGYLQWRWGIQSAMNTSIVRDTKTCHFTVALQVSQERSCTLVLLSPEGQLWATLCSDQRLVLKEDIRMVLLGTGGWRVERSRWEAAL